ncbi:lytic transglycosylase domain-containing protein [Acinetobacter variabilis]|uniref:lytic transglycosylase domain-containing protein n=1 Tax=Acinetobacter variabilis TaxID=70346 RepID=UPI0028B05163|nr:lytic transglycosylase domain-containing protein [Acinetobacter variabilis]
MYRIFLLLLVFFSKSVFAFCYAEAGRTYEIDPLLLIAVSQVESGLNPKAININKKGTKNQTEDLGLMQINTSWLPLLSSKWQISREKLMNDPCQNVYVGAYILALNINKNGVNWKSIGAYNAGFKDSNEATRVKYAMKVYNLYLKFLSGNRAAIIARASKGEAIK